MKIRRLRRQLLHQLLHQRPQLHQQQLLQRPPTETPTVTPTPTETPVVTPTPTETPTPTGTPNFCGGTCGSNYNCQGGLFCYQGFCRNPNNPADVNCNNPTSTPTPPQVLGASTPPQLPATGSNDLPVFAGLFGIMAAGFAIFKKFKLL